MDSPANFYESTDFFGNEHSLDKTQKSNQVFLFESESAVDFGDDLGGLYDSNEDSIDFSQYIHNSGEQPNSSANNYDLLQFGLSALSTSPPKPHEFNLSTSPPKPHEFGLPQLIKSIKPDPDGPYHDPSSDSASDIDTAPCTPAFTDSNPGSPRPGSDDITGEYMPQIGELQGGEALSPTGNYYNQGSDGTKQQLSYQQEPSETASEPGSEQSSPGGESRSKGAKRSRVRSPPNKCSHEYKEKRERNNIAVRKSRLKSKEKNQGLQYRVDELTNENTRLNKRVELLTKELTVLKSLFTNVGKQPPSKLLGAISQ